MTPGASDSDDHDLDRARLSQLLRPDTRERARLKLTGQRRTFIMRWVRLLLPLAALAIVALVIAWPKMEDNMAPVRKEEILPQTVGRNELINPRFESEDSDAQPFTVTAISATQDSNDQTLILLNKPKADIKLNSGHWIAGEADQGEYRQEQKNLTLTGNVRLTQDEGYMMETASLFVDMNTRTVRTSDAVRGSGPAGTLQATGMQGDGVSGVLVFTGPATLVLNRSVKGLSQ